MVAEFLARRFAAHGVLLGNVSYCLLLHWIAFAVAVLGGLGVQYDPREVLQEWVCARVGSDMLAFAPWRGMVAQRRCMG